MFEFEALCVNSYQYAKEVVICESDEDFPEVVLGFETDEIVKEMVPVVILPMNYAASTLHGINQWKQSTFHELCSFYFTWLLKVLAFALH